MCVCVRERGREGEREGMTSTDPKYIIKENTSKKKSRETQTMRERVEREREREGGREGGRGEGKRKKGHSICFSLQTSLRVNQEAMILLNNAHLLNNSSRELGVGVAGAEVRLQQLRSVAEEDMRAISVVTGDGQQVLGEARVLQLELEQLSVGIEGPGRKIYIGNRFGGIFLNLQKFCGSNASSFLWVTYLINFVIKRLIILIILWVKCLIILIIFVNQMSHNPHNFCGSNVS